MRILLWWGLLNALALLSISHQQSDPPAAGAEPIAPTQDPVPNTPPPPVMVKKEPLPSELYENIQLSTYYEAKLTLTDEQKALQDKGTWQSIWKYYSLDVPSTLGSELEVTDENEVLNQLDEDMRLLNTSHFKDLILELIDVDGFSDPNFFIMLNDTLPTTTVYNLSCSFWGEDICVISGAELKKYNTTKITIGVQCWKDCHFQLQAELEAEINFLPGKMHNIYFRENQQRIFRLEIPQDDNVDEIDIRGLSQNKFAQFEMFVVQGNEVPDTHRALILTPAWENGYVGKFYKNCYCFCTGCNYTILISAKSEGYISIGGKVQGKYTDLKTYPGGEIYDAVRFWGTECYNYTVSDPEKDVLIKLQTFSGQPDIYVNPNYPITAENFTKALYNSQDHFWNEELVLEPQVRAQKGGKTGPYYICIYGSSQAIYKLSVKNEDHSMFLKAGISETGYIENNQVKLFYYSDKALMDENIKVKFDAQVMSGSIRVRAKLCSRPDDNADLLATCNITLQEISQPDPDEAVFMSEGNELETPDHNMCFPNQLLFDQNLQRNDSASCIYVIGVQGLSNYTSHYSLVIKLDDHAGQNHPIVLAEGVPVHQEITMDEDQYYTILVEDPTITKLSIQLTTVHGDPDMFVSSKAQPTLYDFEQRSTNSGIFPDVIEIKLKNETSKTFNILVKGWVDSKYSLVYFTSTQNGTIGFQKLMVGKKQKGILHPNTTTSELSSQPSLIYHFAVSSQMLKDNGEIEVRLNAEYGNFLYLVQQGSLPELDSFSAQLKKGQWKGHELNNVIIDLLDVDFSIQENSSLLPQRQDKSFSDQMINFYVQVYPLVQPSTQTLAKNQMGQAFSFTIAFYDNLQFILLEDSYPQRGVITNQFIEYYYFTVEDFTADYELTLTVVSGEGANFVLSFDPKNFFPDRNENDYESTNAFTKDSIGITKEMLAAAQKKGYVVNGKLTAKVGVFSTSPLCVYSILMAKKTDFNPIKLQIGQIQAGLVDPHKKKYYFFETKASKDDKPLKIDLVPVFGNPNLEVTLIKNLTVSKSVWQRLSGTPTYVSESSLGLDTLVLDSKTNKEFKSQCSVQCVVLIAVTNSASPDDDQYGTSFRLQVSQTFEELLDSVKTVGAFAAADDAQNSQNLTRYNFYKFYKGCSLECDMVITVLPTPSEGAVFSVLIGYEDPEDITSAVTKLPTWQNKPPWTVSLRVGNTIIVEGTEPYFFEHHGKVNDTNGKASKIDAKSSGYYYIAIHSYEALSYTIQVTTKPHDSLKENGVQGSMLDVEQLFLGPQDKDIYLAAQESKLFYFQNWRDEDITFTTEMLTHNFMLRNNIEIAVGRGVDRQNNTLNRPPKFKVELPETWMTSNGKDFLELKKTDSMFCIYCTFVVKLTNTFNLTSPYTTGETKLQLILQQTETHQSLHTSQTKVFKNEIKVGKPMPIRLDRGDQIVLYFEGKDYISEIEVELLLGDAKIKLIRDGDDKMLYQHPCPMNSSMFLDENIVTFDFTKIERPNKTEPYSKQYYILLIECTSEILQSVAYIRSNNSLSLLADGGVHTFDFTFSGKSKLRDSNSETQYFMYLPSSHKLDLLVNAQLRSFESELGMFEDLDTGFKIETDVKGQSIFPKGFFNFKVSLKKLDLENDLHDDKTKWTEEFTHDEQFDYVLHTNDTSQGTQLFKLVKFELNPLTDLILVKVDGLFDAAFEDQNQHASLSMNLQLSGSDLTYLAPGQTIRSVVSGTANKQKVFEFYINELNFQNYDKDDGVDLFLTLTPCTGALQFFISDDIDNLFDHRQELKSNTKESRLIINAGTADFSAIKIEHKKSKIANSALASFFKTDMDQFGMQGKRLLHVENLNGKKLFIGVQPQPQKASGWSNATTSNIDKNGRVKKNTKYTAAETAASMESNMSTFEISAVYLNTSNPDILDIYRLKDDKYGIQIERLKGKFKISWSPITMQDLSQEAIEKHNFYSEVVTGVQYKLFLGFQNQTFDMFSSLCQLEETEFFVAGAHKRCLQKDQKPPKPPKKDEEAQSAEQFDYKSDMLKVVSTYGKPEIELEGNDVIKDLKTATVMVHIFRLNESPISFAYPPVSFGADFDSARIIQESAKRHVTRWLIGFFVAFALGGYCALRVVKANNQRSIEHQVNTQGISMRELPSISSMDATTEVSEPSESNLTTARKVVNAEDD